MSRIDELFAQLRAANKKAFMPFVTAGDPDLAFTASVLRMLDVSGCSLCEVGIPYSDPIADGPVIQASYTRALENKTKLGDIFATLGKVAPAMSAPVVTMVSYAIVFRHGLEAYVQSAKKVGVAGAIIPDLPVDEAAMFADICRREDFSLIQLVTPTTPRERAIQIAKLSTGFIYYVSVTGITGERSELPIELTDSVAWLRSQTDLPICIGFGISHPEQIGPLAAVADGFIVGSAIVRRIAHASKGSAAVLDDLGSFVQDFVAAVSRAK